MATGIYVPCDYSNLLPTTFRTHEKNPISPPYGTYSLTHDDMNNVQAEIKKLQQRTFGSKILLVTDFSPALDGINDDAPAFNRALAEAKLTGCEVFAPPVPNGYVWKTKVTIPKGTKLKGVRIIVTQDQVNADSSLKGICTFVNVYTGKGSVTADPAVFVGSSGELEGFVFWYPEQTDTNPPVIFSPNVDMDSADCQVKNCHFLNSYWAVRAYAYGGRRRFINLTGQPIYRGISTDNSWDCDRISNCHFWPFFTHSAGTTGPTSLWAWQAQNGIAYDINRADEIIIDKIFAFGYSSGLKVSGGPSGQGLCYGKLTLFGFDYCKNSLFFDGTGTGGGTQQGWQISNGGLIPLSGFSNGGNGLKVVNYGIGRININNVTVWGDTAGAGLTSGSPIYADSGNIQVNNFSFLNWGDTTAPAIDLLGTARFKMIGGDIGQAGTHIRCATGVPNPIVAYSDIKGSSMVKTLNGQTVLGEATSRFY